MTPGGMLLLCSKVMNRPLKQALAGLLDRVAAAAIGPGTSSLSFTVRMISDIL
jgi:hypothetical protein